MAKKTKQQLLVDTFLPAHEAQLRKDLAAFAGKVREALDEDNGHSMRDAIRWHVFPTRSRRVLEPFESALLQALDRGCCAPRAAHGSGRCRMKARPSIDLARRFPTAWLFLHAWATGDYSALARRHVLLAHRGIGWVL